MTKTEEIMELVTDYGSECLSYGIGLSLDSNADDRLLAAQDKDIALFKLKAAIEELVNELEKQEPTGPLVDGWQITLSDGHSGYGAYAHMTDYPDEGAVFLAAGVAP